MKLFWLGPHWLFEWEENRAKSFKDLEALNGLLKIILVVAVISSFSFRMQGIQNSPWNEQVSASLLLLELGKKREGWMCAVKKQGLVLLTFAQSSCLWLSPQGTGNRIIHLSKLLALGMLLSIGHFPSMLRNRSLILNMMFV